MYKFDIGEKTYKIAFTYRNLADTRFMNSLINSGKIDQASDIFTKQVETVAETILAGLQKFHADEFGFETEEERGIALQKVFDLMDVYDAENAENGRSVIELSKDLNEELTKNRFLSETLQKMEEALKDQTKKKASLKKN